MAGVSGRSGSGGVRPGAGRPRKADKYQRQIADGESRIADRLPFLIDRMFELAEGIEVESIDAEGERRIYSRPPDRDAIKYLMDRVMGKPTERVEAEHSGSVSLNIPIKEVIVRRPQAENGE